MFSAGRQVGAAPPERRPQQHHRRHARVGADQPAEPEHQVADDRRRDDRRERLGQRQREAALPSRQHEERARDDHEQRDRQVRPEQEAVEDAERPEPLRHRLDPPTCGSSNMPPFAGMTRIRF